MSKLKNSLFIVILLAIAILVSGCNAFEAIDHNLSDKSVSDRINDGNIAMASGNHAEAFETFEVLYKEGNHSDAIFRGRSQAIAAKAGFQLLKVIDVIQNSIDAGDSTAALFNSLPLITNFSELDKALIDVTKISMPTNEDRLFSALLAVNLSCHRIVEKYDTNYNRKLDKIDQIDFDTNDDKTDTWRQLFADLTQSPSHQSLEDAAKNAAIALNGRGEPWSFISPIKGTKLQGNYSKANRLTVIAIINLADQLEHANEYFEINETQFKNTILALDGGS